MDKRTEAYLRRISASIPRELIDAAYPRKVINNDDLRNMAQDIIEHTGRSTGNRMNTRKNELTRRNMTTALRGGAFDDGVESGYSEAGMRELDLYVRTKVQQAIRNGKIPPPSKKDGKL